MAAVDVTPPADGDAVGALLPHDCLFETPPGIEVECSSVSVPADYEDPTVGTLELEVAILRSPNPIAADDPVVYLDGGPGGHTLDSLSIVFDASIASLLEDRDLIVFDQRGVGYSSPSLYCGEVTEATIDLINEELPFADELARMETALRQCRARLVAEGIDLSLFNTAANAADVDRLRAAFGYEEWNLFGVSYGTRLAQTVMRDFPDGVRRVVLDSAYPLEADLYGSIPGSADRVFQLLIDSCASDEACNANYPDLASKLRSAFETLNESPIPAVASNLISGAPIEVVIDGDRFIDALFTAFYDTSVLPLLPEVISDAATGNVDAINLILSSQLTQQELLSVGMHLSVQCRDELPFTSVEELVRQTEATVLFNSVVDGHEYAQEQFAFCDVWDVPPSSTNENGAVASDIPTLVLSGEFDPITPPLAGQAVSNNLTEAIFIEFPGVGHGVITTGECAVSVVRRFFAGRELDSACVDEMAGPRWLTPLTELELVPFRSEQTGLTGVIPKDWEESQFGIVARSELGITAFTQQLVPGISADSLLQLFVGQFGDQLVLESVDSPPAGEGEVVWSQYRGEVGVQVLLFATADFGGAAGLVLVTGFPGQEELLNNKVMLPAVAAFQPPEGR